MPRLTVTVYAIINRAFGSYDRLAPRLGWGSSGARQRTIEPLFEDGNSHSGMPSTGGRSGLASRYELL
jgi:hypothetical protein